MRLFLLGSFWYVFFGAKIDRIKHIEVLEIDVMIILMCCRLMRIQIIQLGKQLDTR